MKHWKSIQAILLMVAVVCFASCEKDGKKAREAFLGDYTFVSTGSVDLYAGALKIIPVPLNKEGEMSIVPAEKSNTVWMIAEGDSALAYVSGNELVMQPATDTTTIGGILMTMSYTYGPATLVENQLSLTTNVDITATYRAMSLKGSGAVDIVATKKQ